MMLSTKVLGEGGIKVRNAATILTSADGITWTSEVSGTPKYLQATCAAQ
jgi:hypothetical protein